MIAAGIGVLGFLASTRSIEADAQRRFANEALTASHAIEARLKSYTDVLQSAASVVQTVAIDARQFHAFVERLELELNYPALETINYAVYLRGQDRAELDRVAGPGPNGTPVTIRPPGQRADYLVLAMIEPRPFRNATVGIDILYEVAPTRAVVAARDSGGVSASGEPVRVMSGPNRTGLGMRMPVYRLGAPLTTVSERRAAFVGSIGIGFYVDKLVQGVLREMAVSKVRMTVTDVGRRAAVPAGPGRVLFDSAATERVLTPQLASGRDSFSTTLPVDYHGRTWNVTCSTAKSAMYSAFDVWLPWLALASGAGVSMLSFALLRSLLSARQRAVELARRMTHALRESQARLLRSHQQLRQLAAHADQVKEGERKRIAREIDDDLSQNLLVLRSEADALLACTKERHWRLHARVDTTAVHIDAILESVRQIIDDLRPTVLDLGLGAAVEWQVGEFRKRTGLECEFDDQGGEAGLDDYIATAFFRVLQESLSNIERHANATKVSISLERGESALTMTVSDNGIGLGGTAPGKTGSFGLVGIEERMTLLGGQFSIASVAQGTRLRVSAPVRVAASASSSHATADADTV